MNARAVAGDGATDRTPQERRGLWLYLLLAGFIVLEQGAGAVLAVANGLVSAPWSEALVQPLCLSFAVVYLWNGVSWMRRLVSLACLLTGVVRLGNGMLAWYRLSNSTLEEQREILLRLDGVPPTLVAAAGVMYLVAGTNFLLSPSLQAFVASQCRARHPRTPE